MYVCMYVCVTSCRSLIWYVLDLYTVVHTATCFTHRAPQHTMDHRPGASIAPYTVHPTP